MGLLPSESTGSIVDEYIRGESSEIPESLSALEILETFDVIPWIQERGTFCNY